MDARRGLRSLLIVCGALAVGWIAAACQPSGPPPLAFTVNTAADHPDRAVGDGVCDDGTGHCSLRAALDEVNASSSTGTHVVTLQHNVQLAIAPSATDASPNQQNSGDLDVAANLRVVGNGHQIHGGSLDRIFDQHGGRLELDAVALAGGVATAPEPEGGAVRATGTVVVIDSVIGLNRATGEAARGGGIWGAPGSEVDVVSTRVAFNAANSIYGHGMRGAGIAGAGKVAILNSTINDNGQGPLSLDGGGGGVSFTGTVLTIRNSTITANTAQTTGGGLFVGAGAASVADSTITANTAPVGGAAVRVDGGSLDLRAVTIADNTSSSSAVSGSGISVSGSILASRQSAVCTDPVASGGWNLAVDTSCGLAGAGDHQDGVTGLGLLADNGGSTQTRLPIGGLGAVDAIPAGTAGLCDATTPPDQRGVARPAGAKCDIGAIEGSSPAVAPRNLTVDNPGEAEDANQGDGVCAIVGGGCTLRAAVDEANAFPTADTITVPSGLALTPMAGGALTVTERVSIVGNGAVIDPRRQSQGIDHLAGRLTIDGIRVQRGNAFPNTPTNLGGGIFSTGDLVLTRVVIGGATTALGNVAQSWGGGVAHLGSASVSISRSTFVNDNSALGGGGLYLGPGGHASITESTFTTNTVTLPHFFGAEAGSGAILNEGTLALRNSTLYENADGAIALKSGSATLTAVTLGRNRVGPSVRVAGGQLTMRATIVDPASGPACAGTVGSGGYNVIADTTCGPPQATDHAGANPLLAALAPNGGSARTQLPFLGSPVLDAIPVGTSGLCDATAPTDQRGVARPQGIACDIGAVEGSTGRTIAPLNLIVDVATDARDVAPGDGACNDGSGHCPLRAAVDETNAQPTTPNIITIAPGVNPVLTLDGREDQNATGDLDVTDDLTVHGGGATLDANHLDAGLSLQIGTLHLTDLTIVNGVQGGIIARGDLALDHVTLSGNIAIGNAAAGVQMDPGTDLQMRDSTVVGNGGSGGNVGFGGFAGGLLISGTATITGSTIADNSSIVTGGVRAGATNGAGGEVTIENSTISGNLGGGSGNGNAGGLSVASIVHVRHTTIASNGGDPGSSTDFGGAVNVDVIGRLDLSASILAADQGPVCHQRAVTATLVSHGGNVVSDETCHATDPLDRTSVAPLLRGLVDNGGPTWTRQPVAGSPAVDVIPAGTPGLCDASTPPDQRGVARPQGPACDAGSVEGAGPPLAPLSFVVDTAADTLDTHPGDEICADSTGHCSVRAAIEEADESPTADVVTIGPGVDPVLSRMGAKEDRNQTGDLDVVGDLSIHGGGRTVSAGTFDRAIHLVAGSLTISDLTITGGIAPDFEDGGGILARGALLLDRVTLTGNSFPHDFGGGVFADGTLTMTDSVVTANQAMNSAGVEATGTSATVTNSTISNNTASSGAGGIQVEGTAHLSGLTITGNTGGSGSAIAGVGTGDVVNSTITGNTATRADVGAAIVFSNFTATLWHFTATTIADNPGTSVVNLNGGAMTLAGSVLVSTPGQPGCTGAITSGGWNFSTDASCGLTQPSDVQGADALLAALADNGGPTLTRLPAAGSPLVDRIPIGTVGLCDGTIATDQRGVARPRGSACDIGAVER